MLAEIIIPLLLVIASAVAGVMAYISNKEIAPQQAPAPKKKTSGGAPGYSSYRSDSYRPSSRQDSQPRKEAPRRPVNPDPLGRGERTERRPQDAPKANAESSTGRGYGSAERASHSTGKAKHDRDADNGFSEWASTSGRKAWEDKSPPPVPQDDEPKWWHVLGLPRTAGAKEIRLTYGRLMRELHPDIVGHSADTSQRCSDLNAAYDKARQDAQKHGRP